MIHHGDCLDVMATLEAESIDAIVTDPPYGLGFMGKAWDSPGSFVERKPRPAAEGFDGVGGNHHPTSSADVGRTRLSEGVKSQAWHEAWARAALRVAKPSAYLLAFGGTRTVHRMTVALEDAGWIIRDMLVWAYASGFPKSKASLKPAWEPIVMARKPGPLRMLAIDECRIPFVGGEEPDDREGEATEHTRYTLDGGTNMAAMPGRRIKSDRASAIPGGRTTSKPGGGIGARPDAGLNNERVDFDWQQGSGRWPANVILTDPIFDGGWEGVVGGGEQTGGGNPRWRSDEAAAKSYGGFETGTGEGFTTGREPFDTSGTYSRFFLVPKADRADREPAITKLEPKRETAHRRTGAMDTPYLRGETFRQNHHPTVKPTELMRHLVRLVTPAGGTVLDPFLGSGTTGLAAELEGFPWIGIEKEAEYVAIAEARLNGTQRGLGLVG